MGYEIQSSSSSTGLYADVMWLGALVVAYCVYFAWYCCCCCANEGPLGPFFPGLDFRSSVIGNW